MEVALGVFQWSPPVFWQSTPHELMATLDGWREARGQRTRTPMTRQRLQTLMAKYPDGNFM